MSVSIPSSTISSSKQYNSETLLLEQQIHTITNQISMLTKLVAQAELMYKVKIVIDERGQLKSIESSGGQGAPLYLKNHYSIKCKR